MKPNKLTLEGFTSFRQPTEIDFSGLDLFAITGATGSGKTSIIDALTYALYGRTPRLGAKGLSELISHGASRLSVMLEFESGQKQYRVARVLRRAGTPNVRLDVVEGAGGRAFEGGVLEINASIAQIVGLDYEAFTKAVVLPQGEFDRFLRGELSERRRILESLLKLQVYRDMMQRANLNAKQFQGEQDLIKAQLTAEYLDATEQNRVQVSADIKSLEGDVGSADAKVKGLATLLPSALELRTHRAALTSATEQHEQTEQQVSSAHDVVTAQKKAVDAAQALIEELSVKSKKVAYDEELHQGLMSLLPVAQELELLQQDQAVRRRDLKRKTAEAEQLRDTIEAAGQKYKKASDVRLTKEEDYSKAKQKRAQLKKQHGSADKIEQIAADVQRLSGLSKQLGREERDYGLLVKKQSQLEAEIAKLVEKETQAKSARDEADRGLKELSQRHSAHELRKHLTPGERCPVCEQVVARVPKGTAAAALDKARAERDDRQESWQESRDALTTARSELRGIPKQLELVKNSCVSIKRQIADIAAKAEAVLGKVPEAEAVDRLSSLAETLSAADEDCLNKEDSAAIASQAAGNAKDALAELQQQQSALSEHLTSLAKQVDVSERRGERLLAKLGDAGDIKKIEAALGVQDDAKSRRAQIAKQILAAQEAMRQAEAKQVTNVNRIAGFEGQLKSLARAIANATTTVSRLEQTLKGKIPSIVAPRQADEADRIDAHLIELRTRAAEARQLLEQKKLYLDHLQIRITERRKKLARGEELDRSIGLYNRLGTLLKADQFIRFILEGAFGVLCNAGTAQLETLSQGRYSFSSDRDEFYVIDHWNADERRSVATLSGGESFLASLALALALTASISEFSAEAGIRKLDALFLDEGFSTLDAETLNVAIDALQALQEGDRMIGVISHVADLAERLPSRINVVKNVSGSVVVREAG
jgi:DNA repair protein SbcC/Rad50